MMRNMGLMIGEMKASIGYEVQYCGEKEDSRWI